MQNQTLVDWLEDTVEPGREIGDLEAAIQRFSWDPKVALEEYDDVVATTGAMKMEQLMHHMDIAGPHGRLFHWLFGLAEETGEVMGKFKRLVRGDDLPEDWESVVVKELGDVLWYTVAVAHYFGYRLEDVARLNAMKLFNRKLEGTIKGEGDSR